MTDLSFESAVLGASPPPTNGTWPAPQPLAVATHPVPFPVEVLAPWQQRQVLAAASEMQCPPDLPAQLAITAMSIATAGRCRVHVSSSWYEKTNTYLVTGLRPGENKSPNVKLMIGPLDALEREMADDAAKEVGRVETQRKVLQKAINRAIDKGEVAEALTAQDDLDQLPAIVIPRLIADDSTPEKIGELMRTHDGRLAIVSTEGGVFGLMTGRYSDKPNLDIYLMAWSGDTVRVDRIGRDSIIVRDPALTIGLTVQPDVIAKLAETPELRGRGLTARFMYSVPASLVGTRDMRRITTIDERITSEYAERLQAIARHFWPMTEPDTLRLSREALDVFVDFRTDLERRRLDGNDLSSMVEWSIKLESTVVRLAGLLHLADGVESDVIGAAVMERAVVVGRYWETHARIAHELWVPDPVTRAASRILQWAIDERRTEFSVRDAYNVDRRLTPKADDALEPLQLLIDKGWIRYESDEPLQVGRRGKPSPTVDVHPDAATHSGQVAAMRTMRQESQSEFYLSLSQYRDTDTQNLPHGSHDRMTPEEHEGTQNLPHGSHDRMTDAPEPELF